MTNLANDAWEALLSAHGVLMKQFAAEDVWQGASMREYDVLYTLSKCPDPINLRELNRHVGERSTVPSSSAGLSAADAALAGVGSKTTRSLSAARPSPSPAPSPAAQRALAFS